MWENRKYVLLTADEASGIDYSKVLITNADTLPWNQAETVCYVKYDGNKPQFLSGKDVLSRVEMLEELETSEWAGDPSGPDE